MTAESMAFLGGWPGDGRTGVPLAMDAVAQRRSDGSPSVAAADQLPDARISHQHAWQTVHCAAWGDETAAAASYWRQGSPSARHVRVDSYRMLLQDDPTKA